MFMDAFTRCTLNYPRFARPVAKFICKNTADQSANIEQRKEMSDNPWTLPDSLPASSKALEEEKHRRCVRHHSAKTEEPSMEIGKQ